MGLLDTDFSTVNAKNPRKSDRIRPGEEMNLRGLLDAATNIPIAGDALSGGMAIYDAAKGDYPSAAMNALGVLPFVSGTFIGKGAKTWDALKAADAEKRIAAGDDVRKVWKETGTFKGPDGHLRQEIDDSSALVDMSQVSKQFPGNPGVTTGSGNARDMLDHPSLWNQYTDYSSNAGNLGGYATHLVHDPRFNSIEGEFQPSKRTILMKAGSQEGLKSGLLHEGQHTIQRAEGWATGGNSSNAPMAVIEAKNNALSPLWAANNQYKELSDKAGELSTINYLKKLEGLSKKENIKPSDITNMSPWYEYSDDIRQWIGPMPKKAGANRDYWLRQAAERMLFREKAKVDMPEYRLGEYFSREAKDLKNEYARIDRQRLKHLEKARQYSETERKFNEIGGMSDHEQYRRLAGEAEARATQARMNMNMEQRLNTYPLDSYDVPVDQLIIRGLLK